MLGVFTDHFYSAVGELGLILSIASDTNAYEVVSVGGFFFFFF